MVVILHNWSGIWKPRAVAYLDVIYFDIHLNKLRNSSGLPIPWPIFELGTYRVASPLGLNCSIQRKFSEFRYKKKL
jgi:hypothetical protein